jgi:hypothetical protein
MAAPDAGVAIDICVANNRIEPLAEQFRRRTQDDLPPVSAIRTLLLEQV